MSILRQAQEDKVVIIYLSSTLLLGSICLPSIIERAVLRRWFMWHFSMQGLPAEDVTIISRELLPHVFTLPSSPPPPMEKGRVEVIFCGTICSAVLGVSTQHIRPGSSPVHRSALSGLSSPPPKGGRAITRLVAIISKKQLQKYPQITGLGRFY